MSFSKSIIFALLTLLCTHCMAQDRELIDVVSFFNGGYPYIYNKSQHRADYNQNQIAATSRGRTVNPFYRDDLQKKDGPKESTLLYALAAPATIETFRVGGEDNTGDTMPGRFGFAVSQSPSGPWEVVATFDAPESYLTAVQCSTKSFSWPVPIRTGNKTRE